MRCPSGRRCSHCGSESDTVEEQYSYGVYAGVLCEPCARTMYRDQCGHGRHGQGTREEYEELEGPGSYDGDY